MVIPMPLLERRREGGGYGLCLPLPGKWRSVAQSLDGNGKGVTMAHGLPLLDGRWEGGHGLCPSPPEQWRSVVTATPITLLEGRREGGHGLCLSPLDKRRSVVIVTLIPHPKRKVGKWP